MPLAAQKPKLLTRAADNADLYAVLTAADGVREISEREGFSPTPGFRLIRVDHRLESDDVNHVEIALIDDAELSVAYYDRVTLEYIPKVSRRQVARNQVWRSASMRHSQALLDISKKVLFGYIVDEYDLLLTEHDVSNNGYFYWHRQVSRAIELGLYVYAYEPATQTLLPIPSQSVLNDIEGQVWSGTDHDPMLALVSRLPLGGR